MGNLPPSTARHFLLLLATAALIGIPVVLMIQWASGNQRDFYDHYPRLYGLQRVSTFLLAQQSYRIQHSRFASSSEELELNLPDKPELFSVEIVFAGRNSTLITVTATQQSGLRIMD